MARREFRFEEGASRKFWAVEVDAQSMTIQFGKLGSAGQTQIKSFNSAGEAQKAADKLIAEKTGKGYVEVGGTAPVPAAPPKATPAPTAATKLAAPATAERLIRLSATDWLRARWRERPAPKAPEAPRPFDLDALKAHFAKDPDNFYQGWESAAPPAVVSPQEARFWLQSFVIFHSSDWGKQSKRTLSKKPQEFDKSLSVPQLIQAFTILGWDLASPIVLQLQSAYLSGADWLTVACNHPRVRGAHHCNRGVADFFESHMLPRLDAKEVEECRTTVRKLLTPKGWKETLLSHEWAEEVRETQGRIQAASMFAVKLDLEEELLAYIEAYSPEQIGNSRFDDALTYAIQGLHDRALVEQHTRRLKLYFSNPDDARGWLAHTEHSALDHLRDSILGQSGADTVLSHLGVLLLVESPEAARALLEVRLAAKTSRAAAKIAKWFDTHPEHAAAGLAPLAQEKSKLGQEAAAWLDTYHKRTQAQAAAPSSPAPAAKAVPAVAPKAPPAPERKLNLDPADLARARGPEQPVKRTPAPKPRPFDFEGHKKKIVAYQDELPTEAVTPEEARFWLLVHAHFAMYGSSERGAWLKKMKLDECQKAIPLSDLKEMIERFHYWDIGVPLVRLQSAWLPPDDLMQVLTWSRSARMDPRTAAGLADWLEASCFPQFDESAMTKVRNRLVELINGDDAEAAQVAMILGRSAGIEAELTTCVEKMKKGAIAPSRVNMGWAVALFVLKDGDWLVKEFRRLGLRLVTSTDARTWLALTGHTGLDILRDSILAQKKGETLLELLDVLLLAESPEAAVALMEVRLKAKPPEAGTRINSWMRKNQGHALAAFTPLSVDNSPIGEAARAYLAESGGAPGSPTPPAAPTGGSFEGLRPLLDAVKPAKSLPSYADPAVLPPLPGLDANDVSRVLSALSASTLVGPAPLVAAMRRQCDRHALAPFAWKLFEGWLDAGAPSKEKWAFLAVGPFGDDSCVMKLAPLIRAWPGESQHQRAVTGLEVLRTIGTDTALTQLNGMALKLKFKALQERARQMMDAIATDRGMSREQLEDRIVPDLGLEADGSRVFDFGPRSFRFALSDDLTPIVTDVDGKPLKDLPKPGAKDDATKAATAAEEWKLLKKQLRETLKIQTFRLEESMIAGRSWTPEEFDTLLVRHPLMSHLVRRLVWSGRGPNGDVVCHFRVNETQQWLHHDGSVVSANGVASVRIAHRLHLPSGEAGFWRQELDKRHIHPPFAQLERHVHAVPPGEVNATFFQRPAGNLPSTKVRGNLEGGGWRRVMHDQGGITGFNKPFPSAGVTGVVLLNECIVIGMMDTSDVQIERAFFVRGLNEPHGPCSDDAYNFVLQDRGIPLGEVDPVAFSEMMLDLLSLVPAGK